MELSQAEARVRIFHLAWPSIISELSGPLLSLVDTIVVGHLADADNLAGVALAVAAYNPLLAIFNFLRMGIGGTTAQAFGAKDGCELIAGAARGLFVGVMIGIICCMARGPLASASFALIQAPNAGILEQAMTYYNARIFGLPAAMANYVVQAWLIGVQRTASAMTANLLLNLSNAILCVWFAWGLGLGVAGVGAATAIANYLSLAFGIWQIKSVSMQLPWVAQRVDIKAVFDRNKMVKFVVLNGNIFFRSISLMAIMIDFTALSSTLGGVALAANSMLMQMQMLISFGADGFANAAETMIGEAVGMGAKRQIRTILFASLQWGLVLGLSFTALFVIFGRTLLHAMTWHLDVVEYAAHYLAWQWAAPVLCVTAYLMDGVFAGATQPRAMRDAVILALIAFLSATHAFKCSNHMLWAAYMLQCIVRAGALLFWYHRVEDAADLQTKQLLLESN